MTISALFIFVLTVILVPLALTESEPPPCVTCAYVGTRGVDTYTFSVDDVPERCSVVVYNAYYFDVVTQEADETAIKSLTDANKTVYLEVMFADETNWSAWVEIICGNHTDFSDAYITPLKTYLKDFKISGIILFWLGLFQDTKCDYASKMNSFISNLKEDIPSLKVGIQVSGYEYDLYGKNDLFNFTIANDKVDMYVVDANSVGVESCLPNITKTGRYPITSTDDGVISLEQLCEAVSASSMDQSKLVINLFGAIGMVDTDSGSEYVVSYSEYCSRSSEDGPFHYCSDSIQNYYDQAAYVKPYFPGLMISYVDFDDFNGSCGCSEKFPVTNTIIDGWQCIPITYCDAIDLNYD